MDNKGTWLHIPRIGHLGCCLIGCCFCCILGPILFVISPADDILIFGSVIIGVVLYSPYWIYKMYTDPEFAQRSWELWQPKIPNWSDFTKPPDVLDDKIHIPPQINYDVTHLSISEKSVIYH